jgi:hypothetical protein
VTCRKVAKSRGEGAHARQHSSVRCSRGRLCMKGMAAYSSSGIHAAASISSACGTRARWPASGLSARHPRPAQSAEQGGQRRAQRAALALRAGGRRPGARQGDAEEQVRLAERKAVRLADGQHRAEARCHARLLPRRGALNCPRAGRVAASLVAGLHGQAHRHRQDGRFRCQAHTRLLSLCKRPRTALRGEAVTSSTSRAAASTTSSPVFTRPVGIFHTPCAPAAP